MSSFAVFLLLGGATAFAAVQKIGANEIKANSIKTGKIVKEAVTAGKIKKNAVTESRIADGAVTTNKLADNAVTTPKIANDAVTGEKVKESTLGTVPTASNALNLGGTPASGYAKSTLEPVHLVGAPGEPVFENSCKNISPGFQPAGFYKDGFGIVHIVGDVNGCSSETTQVFVLPPGFRPATSQRFITHKGDTTIGTVRIDENGDVLLFSTATAVFNGMYFRTD